MKKLAIMVIALAMLTGLVLADAGIKQTPETQGLKVETDAIVLGTIDSDVSLDWEITNQQALNDPDDSPPPLTTEFGCGSTLYQVTFEEDTLSEGMGFFDYGTTMDVETSNVIVPNYNIETTKSLYYTSAQDGAGRIVSTDEVTLDGAGLPFCAEENREMCPFSPANQLGGSEAFCNYVEMGNSIDMDFASVETGTDVRFITKAADYPVEVGQFISVGPISSTSTGTIGSSGEASAYMEVDVKEGRFGEWGSGAMYEQLEFDESTTFTGTIDQFLKVMYYESGPTR